MPTDYSGATTAELKGILLDPSKSSEHADALAELLDESREITEESTTDTAMYGGISPTRRP